MWRQELRDLLEAELPWRFRLAFKSLLERPKLFSQDIGRYAQPISNQEI
jgi:hypothetical protein